MIVVAYFEAGEGRTGPGQEGTHLDRDEREAMIGEWGDTRGPFAAEKREEAGDEA